MAQPVFLDTNIFMYAAGGPHLYKAPCLAILADVETGVLDAAVNTEVFQELLYRYSHIKVPEKGIQLCRELLQYPVVVLPISDIDIHRAVDLFDAYQSRGIKPRDAIHAATMQNNGISHLISTDKEFDRLGFVTRIDPLVYKSPK